jgi:hypothetical protein
MGTALHAIHETEEPISWRQRIADALDVEKSLQAPLLVAALLRITLMVTAFTLTGITVRTQGDATSYLNSGRNLILHGAFITAGAPEIDRTPRVNLSSLKSPAWRGTMSCSQSLFKSCCRRSRFSRAENCRLRLPQPQSRYRRSLALRHRTPIDCRYGSPHA